MWGLISGMVIGLTRLGAKVYYSNAGEVADSTFKYLFYDMNWLFFCGWMFLFCIIVVIVVSLATEAPTAERFRDWYSVQLLKNKRLPHVQAGITGILSTR